MYRKDSIISAEIPTETFSARNVSAFRGEVLILKNINISIAAGESLLIQGPNGIGKSTLLRLLAGFRKIDSGEILWNNQNIADDYSAHMNRIAWLGHQDSLKSSMTLRENLLLPSSIYKSSIETALKSVQLDHLAEIPMRMLSAGQKRRVALARLLLKPASLWLLDEPSSGLDTKALIQLGEIFHQFQQKGGMIIATTHIPLPLKNPKILEITAP